MARKASRRKLASVSKNVGRRVVPVAPGRRTRPKHKVLSLTVTVPRSVASQARRVVYTYPRSKPLRLQKRHIRRSLVVPKEQLRKVTVRVRVPRRLPLMTSSIVELRRKQLVTRSRRNVRRAIDERRAANRLEYSESKARRRMARHGQLESRGATSYGMVAASYMRGDSIHRIADHALAARAIRQYNQRGYM